MTEFLQPDAAPAVDGEYDWLDRPADPWTLNRLLPLSTEEIAVCLDGIPQDTRIEIIRDLQELRQATADTRAFDEEVLHLREKKRARREADRLDREERDAYLTSTEGMSAAAQAFESDLIDLDDIPDLEPIIDGYLHRETLVRTFGPPKSLKSFATLDMAACVSLGIEWQGRRTEQTTVLYVVAEGLRGVKKRRDAWNEHHETEMKVIFYPKPVQIGDQEEMYRLIAFCRLKQVGYVIFDTQARCTVGVDENDNTEMGEIVAALDILKRETKACVHMVHHSVGSDPKKARGATAWDGAVDAEFYTKRDRDSDTVELHTKFQKDISEAEPLKMVTREVGASLVLERVESGPHGGTGEVAPALVTEAQAVYLETVREMAGPCTRTDVYKALRESGTPRSDTAVKRNINKLVGAGALEEHGTKLVITQAGLVYLDQARKQGSFEGSPGTLWGTQGGNPGEPWGNPPDQAREP